MEFVYVMRIMLRLMVFVDHVLKIQELFQIRINVYVFLDIDMMVVNVRRSIVLILSIGQNRNKFVFVMMIINGRIIIINVFRLLIVQMGLYGIRLSYSAFVSIEMNI